MASAYPASSPLISVVIPVHNRQVLLARALRSLQSQAFGHFEVVVVDDGSIDDPASIVTALQDPRFRYIRQKQNGAASARNRGGADARGEYVVFLDSDDEALPDWLAAIGSVAKTRCPPVICLGVQRVNDETGEIRRSMPISLGPLYRNMEGLFLAGSYAIQRTLLGDLGGFDVDLPAGHHTDLSLRLCERLAFDQEQIVTVKQAGVLIHDHAGTKIRRDHQAVLRATEALLNKHASTYERCPRVMSEYLATAAVSAYRIKERADSVRLLWQACRRYPRAIKNWARLGLAISGVGRLVWRGHYAR